MTVLADQNLLSFYFVLLGPNFHFHTYKALTSEEVACVDGHSSCWHCFSWRVPSPAAQTAQLLLKHVPNPTHNSSLIWDYLVLSECKSGEVQLLLLNKAKNTGGVWKAGQLRPVLSILPELPRHQAFYFINTLSSSGRKHDRWGTLLDNAGTSEFNLQTGWTGTVISQITVKDSNWGFNWYSYRNM